MPVLDEEAKRGALSTGSVKTSIFVVGLRFLWTQCMVVLGTGQLVEERKDGTLEVMRADVTKATRPLGKLA